jgi:hypothetical protein
MLSQPHNVPLPMRVLASFIQEEVIAAQLGNGRSAVGGFLLLRVILPVLTNPLALMKVPLSPGRKKGPHLFLIFFY